MVAIGLRERESVRKHNKANKIAFESVREFVREHNKANKIAFEIVRLAVMGASY